MQTSKLKICLCFVIFVFSINLWSCTNGGSSSTTSNSPYFGVNLIAGNGSFTNNAKNVSLIPNILLEFSQAVNASSLNNNLSITNMQDGTTVKFYQVLRKNNNLLVINPTHALSPNTIYTIKLNDKIKSLDGSSLIPATFTFTTSTVTLPKVSILEPANTATGISLIPQFEIKFSEAMANVNSQTVTLHEGSISGNNVGITNIVAGKSGFYVFNSSKILKAYTTYYLVLDGNIKDLAGNSLEPISFSFTTANVKQPLVSIVTPNQGSIDVPITTDIIIKFNTAMLEVNVNNIALHQGSLHGSVVNLKNIIADANNTYHITLTHDLALDTTYYLYVGGTIKSTDGLSIQPASFNFTTSPAYVYAVSSTEKTYECMISTLNNSITNCSPIHESLNYAYSGFSTTFKYVINNKIKYMYLPATGGFTYCSLNENNRLNTCKTTLIQGAPANWKPVDIAFKTSYDGKKHAIIFSNNYIYTYYNGYDCIVNDGPLEDCQLNDNIPLISSAANLTSESNTIYVSNFQIGTISSCSFTPSANGLNCTNINQPFGGYFQILVTTATGESFIYGYNNTYEQNHFGVNNCVINPDGTLNPANCPVYTPVSPSVITLMMTYDNKANNSSYLYLGVSGNNSTAIYQCNLGPGGIPGNCGIGSNIEAQLLTMTTFNNPVDLDIIPSPLKLLIFQTQGSFNGQFNNPAPINFDYQLLYADNLCTQDAFNPLGAGNGSWKALLLGNDATIPGITYYVQVSASPLIMFPVATATTTHLLTNQQSLQNLIGGTGYAWYGDNTGSEGQNCDGWTSLLANSGGAMNETQTAWIQTAFACSANANLYCVQQPQ